MLKRLEGLVGVLWDNGGNKALVRGRGKKKRDILYFFKLLALIGLSFLLLITRIILFPPIILPPPVSSSFSFPFVPSSFSSLYPHFFYHTFIAYFFALCCLLLFLFCFSSDPLRLLLVFSLFPFSHCSLFLIVPVS